MTTPTQRLEKSLTKDNLWLYILTLLKKKDLYPYEVREKIKEEFGFQPGRVTAYIVMKKLEKGGYVQKSKKEKKGGPERKYYSITEKGRKELERGEGKIEKWIKRVADKGR